MIDLATFTTAVLEIGSDFLKSPSRDRRVQEAYNGLITSLEKRHALPPLLQDQLARYQVERGELLKLLEQLEVPSKDTEIFEATQRLLSAVEQAVEENHTSNLNLMESAYSQHRSEQKIWSRFSITVAFLGFLLIFTGIASIYLVNSAIGIVVTVAGVIINLTSALFFRQANHAAAQANNKYEKLAELENIGSSATFLSSLRTRLNRLAS